MACPSELHSQPARAGAGPLFEGLPTLEDHRRLDVSLTARHLAALGVQSAFIGDAQPSDAELEALAARAAKKRRRRLKAASAAAEPGSAISCPIPLRPAWTRPAI